MLFSVVIPLYNKAAYIEQTINSVLAQSETDFEIIVVDDGSRDEGPAAVAAMRDPRIRLVRQANAGVAVARNHGISIARGQWIAFLDADDVWRPQYLAVQRASIASCPEVRAVATGFYAASDLAEWTAAAHVESATTRYEIIRDLPGRWMQSSPFFTSSIAVRADVLKAMPHCFAPGESVGEDLDLWFRIAEKYPIALVAEPLVAYRLDTAGSLSASHARNTMAPYLVRMRDRARSGLMSPDSARSALRYFAQSEITLSRQALIEGDRPGARAWLASACPQGLRIRRWWVTLVFVITPAALVRRWESWRLARTALSVPGKSRANR